jgi:multiple sugar transport system permease protein
VKNPIFGGAGAVAEAVTLPRYGTPRPSGMTRFLESERLLAALLLAPTVALLGVFIAYPFVMGVWLSLSSTSVGNIGQFVGIKNFAKAWDDSIFQQAFRNTFVYTFWATIFKLALGMWLAVLLNRNFRGKRLVRASMLLPFIIPTVLSTFAWRWMFDPTFSVLNWLLYKGGFIVTKVPFLSDGVYGLWCDALARLRFPLAGLLGTSIFVTYLVPPTLLFIPLADIIRNFQLGNTPWALILTYPTFLIPFCTWLLMGYFKTIPKELEECARIDGATRFGAMVRIIFPIAVPGILSAGIFAFTLSWNEFIYALIFLSSPEKKTVPVGVVSELIRGDIYFWGQLMAGALLGSIPVALVYSFFVEYYVTGLTGSVKG